MAQNRSSEEIDMRYLFRKFKNFFKSIIRLFYLIIMFFVKFWIIILVLLIIGIGWGYFKSKNAIPVYNNEGIVIPNFGSVDYVYASIDEINNRISSGDTLYLKEAFGKDYSALKEISIEPIADIYNTMGKTREQIDVFRIVYQNQDLDKFLDNLANSKYFKYHKIEFVIEGDNKSKEVISNVISKLNENEHFTAYKSIYQKDALFQVEEFENMFSQIDSVISTYYNEVANSKNQEILLAEQVNLTPLFLRKKDMLSEYLDAKVKVSDYTEPVKVVFMSYDIQQRSLSPIIKYPIILIGLFALIFFFRYLFLKMRRIATVEVS